MEWARLNSNKIPAFLSQMRRTLKFRGWFKCYYDTLRFMYERVTGIEALKITSLECELSQELFFIYAGQGRKMFYLGSPGLFPDIKLISFIRILKYVIKVEIKS